MSGMQTSVLLAIGTRKGLWLARSDDREAWKVDGPYLLATEVPSVAIDARGGAPRLLVGARSEHWGPTVQHSEDLGQTWTEHEGGAIVFPESSGASLERVWQIHPDTAARPGLVWAGCEPTSLWRSTDGGSTFSLVEGLWDHPHRPQWYPGFGGAAVHTVLPHPSDDSEVTVAMSTGGVYRSQDGGQSWRPYNSGIKVSHMPDPYPEFGQCVHKVAPAGQDGQRMYAQNHHGVYRSDDGGQQWTSIADGLPADFGFVALGHPRDRDRAWVVPLVADAERVPPQGKLRVLRTDDAGHSWTASESGLPDHCWVTPLRDAACVDDLDPVGVYFGTRAGSVYASGDEGRTFTTVAENLPDVLCVRAAVVQD
ncbi:exo-alpha-sialidase [Angustibacter sp. McL0619]|uniref:exo-alpha-sialidase n=1 Tax=Angustibacter sp. McL0619 TaxID=3415676 RepID=UPI003CEB8683